MPTSGGDHPTAGGTHTGLAHHVRVFTNVSHHDDRPPQSIWWLSNGREALTDIVPNARGRGGSHHA